MVRPLDLSSFYGWFYSWAGGELRFSSSETHFGADNVQRSRELLSEALPEEELFWEEHSQDSPVAFVSIFHL